MSSIVGISLKAYFDPPTTRSWLNEVAAMRIPDGVDVVVFPEATLIPESAHVFSSTGILVGAQDVSRNKPGAHTGEIPAQHLAALNVRYVEIGHAERRASGDNDADVVEKARLTVAAGLIPWLCVSGPREAYDAGGVIAYEPLLAIGAQSPPTASSVLHAVTAIRDRVPVGTPVLYGGSAGPGTAAKYKGIIDGLFVGRFGHRPKDFLQIINEVAEFSNRNNHDLPH